MNINTIKNTFSNQSQLFKQLVGAVAGITVGTLVYFSLQYYDASSLQGRLLDNTSGTFSTVGTVSVADKTVDADTLNRLTARAKVLQAQLNETDSNVVIDQQVQERLQRRLAVAEYARLSQPQTPKDPEPQYMSAPQAAALIFTQTKKVAADMPVKKTTVSITPPAAPAKLHAGAPLPQTGMATDIMVLLALAGSIAAWMRPLLKRTLVAVEVTRP